MEATAKLNAVSRYQTETAFCRLRALRAVIASLCVVSGWDGDDDDDDETDSRKGWTETKNRNGFHKKKVVFK